uniref:NADH dehydrogenase subunit 6 n=1 Tax=Dexistes rikuzenius TaxID=641117 RepID=UPI0021B65101|nr:NADH dehydrogenase subunit 6 [Dexistes rikuzenius]UVW81918.1 NADH dehydrogenase subunit 6 [Dexistes rikuzenius]
MAFVMYFILFFFVLGLVAVASNPSPYYAAYGLVVVAGVGCSVLIGHGAPFLSMILFLIYLGGMLVVFAFAVAMASEPYPVGWNSRAVLGNGLVYIAAVAAVAGGLWGGWYESSWVAVDELGETEVFRGDLGGVAMVYGSGGGLLVVSAGVLFLTLLVVLEISRPTCRGTLRQ